MGSCLVRRGRGGRRGGLRQPTDVRARGRKQPLRERPTQWVPDAGGASTATTPVRKSSLERSDQPIAGRRRCEKACGWRERRATMNAAEAEEVKGDDLESTIDAITKRLDFSELFGGGEERAAEERACSWENEARSWGNEASRWESEPSCWTHERYLTYRPLNDQENYDPNVGSGGADFSPGDSSEFEWRLREECRSELAPLAEAHESPQPLRRSTRKAKPMTNTWTLDSPTSEAVADSAGAARKKKKRRKRSHCSRRKARSEDHRPNLCILQRMFGP